MSGTAGYILALDVGSARIGVAVASTIAKIASPLTYIENDESLLTKIESLLSEQSASLLVVGLPQTIDGNDTQQTKYIRDLVARLKKDLSIPIVFCDEANTSQLAEEELRSGGAKFSKGDVDALSASFILQRYLNDTDHIFVNHSQYSNHNEKS